jgi:CspA family cold shock protein
MAPNPAAAKSAGRSSLLGLNQGGLDEARLRAYVPHIQVASTPFLPSAFARRAVSRLRSISKTSRLMSGQANQGERCMATGKVKFFNAERGFGFIQPEGGGKDVFVHISAVEAAGLRHLAEGQQVTFDIEKDRRGRDSVVNLRAG